MSNLVNVKQITKIKYTALVWQIISYKTTANKTLRYRKETMKQQRNTCNNWTVLREGNGAQKVGPNILLR